MAKHPRQEQLIHSITHGNDNWPCLMGFEVLVKLDVILQLPKIINKFIILTKSLFGKYG